MSAGQHRACSEDLVARPPGGGHLVLEGDLPERQALCVRRCSASRSSCRRAEARGPSRAMTGSSGFSNASRTPGEHCVEQTRSQRPGPARRRAERRACGRRHPPRTVSLSTRPEAGRHSATELLLVERRCGVEDEQHEGVADGAQREAVDATGSRPCRRPWRSRPCSTVRPLRPVRTNFMAFGWSLSSEIA